jgi:outer membrane protein W
MRRHLVTAAVLAAAASTAAAQESALPFTLPEFTALEKFKPDLLIGARAGFVMATDAEEAVPFIGAGARFPIADIAAVEFSFDVWQDEFANGDAKVLHYPVMVSGMFYFPLETPNTAPYIIAGVGMHNFKFEYSGALSGEQNDTDAEFSFHGGAGLELTVGRFLKVHMDVRWILMDPDPAADALKDEEFDSVQFSFALDLRF